MFVYELSSCGFKFRCKYYFFYLFKIERNEFCFWVTVNEQSITGGVHWKVIFLEVANIHFRFFIWYLGTWLPNLGPCRGNSPIWKDNASNPKIINMFLWFNCPPEGHLSPVMRSGLFLKWCVLVKDVSCWFVTSLRVCSFGNDHLRFFPNWRPLLREHPEIIISVRIINDCQCWQNVFLLPKNQNQTFEERCFFVRMWRFS